MVAEGVEQGTARNANEPAESKRPRRTLEVYMTVEGLDVYSKEFSGFFDCENVAGLLRNGRIHDLPSVCSVVTNPFRYSRSSAIRRAPVIRIPRAARIQKCELLCSS